MNMDIAKNVTIQFANIEDEQRENIFILVNSFYKKIRLALIIFFMLFHTLYLKLESKIH